MTTSKDTPPGERYFKDVADFYKQTNLWLAFAAQAPCPFKPVADCAMHAHHGQTPEKVSSAKAWLKKFETFKIFKRMTK